jgi:hypothetical protein
MKALTAAPVWRSYPRLPRPDRRSPYGAYAFRLASSRGAVDPAQPPLGELLRPVDDRSVSRAPRPSMSVCFPVRLNCVTMRDAELATAPTTCCSSTSALPVYDTINSPIGPKEPSPAMTLAPGASNIEHRAISCPGSALDKRRKPHGKREPMPWNSRITDHALKMPQIFGRALMFLLTTRSQRLSSSKRSGARVRVVWPPEHSHIPTSHKPPSGGGLPKRYYDAREPS